MVDIAFGPSPRNGPQNGPQNGPDDARRAADPSYLALLRRRRLYTGITIALFAALMAAGFSVAENRNAGGFWDGLHRLDDFPIEVLSEAFAKRAALPGVMWDHLPSLLETLNIAAVSTLLGTLAAGGLALLATRGLAPSPVAALVFRRLTDIARALPEIVVALVLIFLLGPGPVAAVIAIALHTAGALGKLFAEVAENADLRPVEGLASTGARWGQRMALAVLPQVAPNWLSYAMLRLEINVRASAILGFVGSGGIGYDLKLALQWGGGKYEQVVGMFLLLFITIVVIDQVSDRARARLVRGRIERAGA